MDFSLGSMLGIKKKKPVPPTAPEPDPLASVKEAQEALAKSQASYGGATPAVATPAPPPPAPSPVVPAAAPATTVPGVIDSIKANRDALRSAAAMKDGGIVEKALLKRRAEVKQKRGC